MKRPMDMIIRNDSPSLHASRKEYVLNTKFRSRARVFALGWGCGLAVALTSLVSTSAAAPSASPLPSQQFQPSLPEGGRLDKFGRNPTAVRDPNLSTLTHVDVLSTAKQCVERARVELSRGNTAGAVYWHDKAAHSGARFPAGDDTLAALTREVRAAGGRVDEPVELAAALPGADNQGPSRGSSIDQLVSPGANDATAPFSSTPRTSAVPQVAPAATSAAPNAYPATATPLPTTEAQRRAVSNQLLINARKALGDGDVRRASDALEQVKALKINYEPNDDNPTKLEGSIQRYADLLQRPAAEKNGEAYRRKYAELQLQQAEFLAAWREFDAAERLVNEAQRLGVPYGPYETKPEQLLQKIAEARKNGGLKKLDALPALAGSPTSAVPTVNAPQAAEDPKTRCLDLLRSARTAIAAGDLNQAEALAKQAEQLRVADNAFAPQEDRPYLVLFEVQKFRAGGAVQTGGVSPLSAQGPNSPSSRATNAVYDPNQDTTRVTPVALQQTVTVPPGVPTPANNLESPNIGVTLFQEGEAAARRGDNTTAANKFREAAKYASQLDAAERQRMQDFLQGPGGNLGLRPPQNAPGALITETATNQQLLVKQVSADVGRQEQVAGQMRETDPKRAMQILRESRAGVEKAPLDGANRDLLLRKLDKQIAELQQYLDSNRGRIELIERNQAVENDIQREQQMKVEVQEKLALKVEEFNKLVEEHRYAEAELVAKQCRELSPNEPVVIQLDKMARMMRSIRNNEAIRADISDGMQRQMESVLASSAGFDDRDPYTFGDVKEWNKLTDRRRAMFSERGRKRTDREMEIEQRMRTPVSLKFKDAPLSDVIQNLGKLAKINMHLDPRGLAEEGIDPSTPVSIELSQEISLKSALSLILQPLRLGYVIKDEVLKITSDRLKDGDVYSVTYNVADLVIPIPNFVPSARMGLQGALDSAYQTIGMNGPGGGMGASSPLAVIASNDGASSNATLDPRLLGQINVGGQGGAPGMGMGGMGGMRGGGGATGYPQQIGFGPGGMGGGAQPDFDSLIQLITGTIAPTTWTDVGGQGAVRRFATNLSLVVSQTQQVHEEIADLLEQLRRLQDLQVTIEVRFISLSDNFFEQMGVDFDLNLNDNADRPYQIFGRQDPTASTQYNNTEPGRNTQNRDLNQKNSTTIGITGPTAAGAAPLFSSDLDIPFRQTSFDQARLINFGTQGAGVSGGASLGFAILSDIEAYFFMNAVQSDIRTNVLQAPKVTLFNGQQAFVSDTSQSPFVVSVVPVVGDFAAAQQPVIVVLSEGTFLTVQAVVSSDRRFVRLTVVPFFSKIGAVNTFTFTGSSTSTRNTTSQGPDTATTSRSEQDTASRDGTTVQLPTFAFTTVTTTVSVPDGGTVLLGGIKRLSEERRENGVPILSKLPYVNRLFTNIGTGKSSSSLMMMVTPRIIIQEEEEALLGVQSQP